MKILLVAPFFPPQRAVAALRTHSFASVWAAAGHEVTVLTTEKRPDQMGQPMPHEGFRVVEIPYRGPWLFEKIRERGRLANDAVLAGTPSRMKRTLGYLKRRTGVFSGVRQPDLTDAWIHPAVTWAKTQTKWDVVVSSGGPPAAHLLAMQLRQSRRAARFVADFRDLWVDNHLYAGLFPFTMLERHRERQVLSEADLLVSVSPPLADRLAKKSGRRAEVIYNGYDPEAFENLPLEPAFPADGRVRLVYTGTVYEQGQDIRPLCAAVAAEPSATLVVASDRADFWQAARTKYHLGDRLDFRGSLPRVEALRMQRDASAVILLDWRDSRQGVLTGKLFEYLRSPAPIWLIGGPRISPAKLLVEEARRGIAFGSDVVAIRQAINGKIRCDGPANRGYIEGLTREAQAMRLLSLLTGLVI